MGSPNSLLVFMTFAFLFTPPPPTTAWGLKRGKRRFYLSRDGVLKPELQGPLARGSSLKHGAIKTTNFFLGLVTAF